MRYVIDHDYHIHSCLSSCSDDPEQNTGTILEYAKENSLKKICVTDHFWDENVDCKSAWYRVQNFSHISENLPLPKADGIEFLFGAETEFDKEYTLGISKKRFNELDFVIVPTTHLHMKGFTISEEDCETAQGRANIWIKKFETLLNMDLPFSKIGIAHLACVNIAPERAMYLDVLNLLPEKKLADLFGTVQRLGAGIEINSSDMNFKDEEADTVLRIFRIAKKMGCKFYLGSDAHHPDRLYASKAIFERAIDLLELAESDKFHIT